MRRKPITRDEVRFNGRHITTLPLDSVRKDARWGDVEPIRKLWAPLLRSLNRAQRRDWDSRAALRAQAAQAGVHGFKEPQLITVPFPRRLDGPHKCQQCSGKFYRTQFGSSRYCCDQCATEAGRITRAASNAVRVKALSAARAAARADRKCATCGKAIKSKRSTMRFCSVRCRVAAHRNANGVPIRTAPPSISVTAPETKSEISRPVSSDPRQTARVSGKRKAKKAEPRKGRANSKRKALVWKQSDCPPIGG